MVGIVKEINGQKKIVPLTTDTGTGAPVGTLVSQYKKVPMSGYLYCDGSTFDENDYPALYMYLGTNVLPDYRECVMVGAEQNTTDTITTHDVYGEGEFKDDQMQRITGSFESADRSRSPNTTGAFSVSKSSESWFALDTVATNSSLVSFDSATMTRTGNTNTTHGKQKAVYVYIKATSGLAENQQENVLNEVKGYVDGKIDDTTKSDTKTWSSSKIYSSITEPQPGPIIRRLSTVDTGFSLAQAESSFYGRLLQIDGHITDDAATMSFLIFVKSNYNNPTSVYATQIAGLYDTGNDIYTNYFDLGVSSNGTLTIKNKTDIIARYRFI